MRRPVTAVLLAACAVLSAVGAAPAWAGVTVAAPAAEPVAAPAVAPVAAPAAAPVAAPAAEPVAAPAVAPVAAPAAVVSVGLDKPAVSTSIGGRFGFTSTIRNDGDTPMTGVIAHLNVLSVDPAVYVDPEDWSGRRTQYLDVLAAHSAARLTWDLQAVNAGRFAVYVTVTTRRGADDVSASSALRVTVAQQRTLNPNGIVPLAAGIPLGLLVLLALAARRRRRLS